LGGIGKTEFAAKCIAEFVPEDKVVWFNCTSDSNIDSLIEKSGFSALIKSGPTTLTKSGASTPTNTTVISINESKTELAKCSSSTDLIESEGKFIFLDNFQDVEDTSIFILSRFF